MESEEKQESLKLAKAAYSIFNPLGRNDQWSPDDVDKLETFDIKKYHEVVNLCRFFYRKDPIAGTVINKMIEIGITPIIFDQGKLSDNEFRIFQGIRDKLQEYIESCALEYLISGLVIPEIKFATIGKDDAFDLGIKKYSSLTLPVSMWLRDPTTVKIRSTMIMDEPSYYVVLPEELIYFILNEGVYPDGNKDEKLYQELKTYYPEFIAQVEAGNKEVLLENDLIVRRRPLSDTPYPTPYLYNSLEALKHKRNLRRMDYSIASRVISAIQLFQLGNDEFPVTEDNEDAFEWIKNQMTWRNTAYRNVERVFQLFADHTLQISWVFPDVTALISDKKYTEVNADIFLGLGFPKILTTGETERTQTSDPEFASISPVETMKNMQKKLLFILKGIVKGIVINNNLKSVPEVRFENINLHTFQDFVNGMKTLYDTRNISRTSFAKAFGYTWEEEVNTLSDENEKLKELGVEEFAPQPFSPQPENDEQNNKKDNKNNTKNDEKI